MLLLRVGVVRVITMLDFVFISAVVGTKGLTMADTVLCFCGVEAKVTVGSLGIVGPVSVADFATVEGLVGLLVHGLFDDEFDGLMDVVIAVDSFMVSNASFLRDDVTMATVVLEGSLLDIDLVMDGLILGPLTWLVVSGRVLQGVFTHVGLTVLTLVLFALLVALVLDIQMLDCGCLVLTEGVNGAGVVVVMVHGVVCFVLWVQLCGFMVISMVIVLMVKGVLFVFTFMLMVIEMLCLLWEVVAGNTSLLMSMIKSGLNIERLNGCSLLINMMMGQVVSGLVMNQVLRSVLVMLMLSLMVIATLTMVRVAIGVIERVVNGVLVEVNWLDIVLVVILMVEGMAIFVPLRFVVGVLVMVGLVMDGFEMGRFMVLRLVNVGLVMNGLKMGRLVVLRLVNVGLVVDRLVVDGLMMDDGLMMSGLVVNGLVMRGLVMDSLMVDGLVVDRLMARSLLMDRLVVRSLMV